MPRCPNCSYMLVLLEKRRKYKCAKCSKLFFQKEIDNRHFREQNKRIFLEDMKRINPSMYYHREFAKNHPEKIKQYQINYKRNKLEGRFKKRLNLTDEDRRERTNRYARAYYYKNKDNIKEKLSFLEKSSRLDDVLAAADLYSLVGFYKEATDLYLKIVSDYPERGKIWMILGSMELNKVDQENSNANLALLYLQRAIEAGWKTTESYSYLALAHYRLGNIEEAKQAVYKELKIDKDSLDAKSWLETLKNYESK